MKPRESVCVVLSCMLLLDRGVGVCVCVCVCDLSAQALKNVCVTSLGGRCVASLEDCLYVCLPLKRIDEVCVLPL